MLNDKPIIVAEQTTNAFGHLGLQLKMIEESAKAGASIIKMQKKDVETFYTQEKLDSPYPSPFGKTYRDYRTQFEFDLDDFKKIDDKCKSLGIPWYSTIQDKTSFTFFRTHFPQMPMVKLASCNAKHKELWHLIKEESECPIVVSIGGQSIETVDEVVNFFNDRTVYIQQCTSTYPCPYDQLYLGNIVRLKDRYKKHDNVKIGYSGHEKGYVPSVLSAYLGAEIIERHFCLSRDTFIHHPECSLETKEFAEMVDTIRHLDKIVDTKFGMKESEKKFLVDNTYGTDYLQKKWNK